MKKLYFLFILCFSIGLSFAQHVPQGMKYQAVARNSAGNIIANQQVSLKINLVTQQAANTTVYYSEIHTVTTNQLGLFTLSIGEGTIEKGVFSSIPWSSADIWMQVAIKDKGKSDYILISNSKLLTVPYAFHSETANSLVGKTSAIDPKVNQTARESYEGQVCSCQEGLASLQLLYLGNSNVDIKVFEDNNLKKLIATLSKIKNGDIVVVSASSPRKKLPDELYFQIQNSIIPVWEMPSGCNDAIVGETFGKFSVVSRTDAKGSVCSVCEIKQVWKIGGNVVFDPCNWLGTKSKSDLVIITDNTDRVRVTADGNVNINNTLNVGKNLNVNGAANLQNTLDVTGATHLKNTLTTDGIETITNNTASANTTTGALVVTGGVGIGGDLNIGGKVNFGGASSFGGQLHITDLTQSTNTTTGALIVDGGTGIGKNLNVGGTANVTGATTLSSTLEVTKTTHLKDSLVTDGATNINNSLTVIKNDPNFVVTIINTNDGEGDGLKIKLGKAKSAYTPNTPTFNADEIKEIEDFKNLIRCDYPGGATGKVTLLGKIATAGAIEDLKSMAGIAVGAGNMIINFLNDNLKLPLKVGPYSTPAFHLSNKIDVTGPINDKLKLPIVLPALDIPQIDFPKISTPSIVIDVPVIPTFTIPGATITEKFKLFGPLHLIDATTVMPKLPALEIPALDIPELNVLPQITVMPKLPEISIPGITPVNIFSVDFWGIPEICLTDGAGSTPLNNDNEFIKFTDKDDKKVGSIRGVSVTDWAKNYLNPSFLFKLRGALLSSKVDKFHAQYHFKKEISTALASYATIGVEYSSGNGDYAEWLERMDKDEFISAGDIIGVKGGKITKELKGAEQIMVVSSNPIILGNTPAEGKNFQGNNIAFMGQVPVKIMGPVSSGDYILGQSNTPGYGIAKHPNQMSIEDYKNAVGRSWANDLSDEPKMVNTVVGVHNNNFLDIIKDLKQKQDVNDERLKAIETKLYMSSPVNSKISGNKKLK